MDARALLRKARQDGVGQQARSSGADAQQEFLAALRGERGPRAKVAALKRLKEVQRAKAAAQPAATGGTASMPPPPAPQSGHQGARRSDTAASHRPRSEGQASAPSAKPSRAVNPAQLVRTAVAKPPPAAHAQRPTRTDTAPSRADSAPDGAESGAGALPQGFFDDGVQPAGGAAAAPPANALGLPYGDDSGDEGDGGNSSGGGGAPSAEGKGGDGSGKASDEPQSSLPEGFFDSRAEDDQARGVDRAAEAAETAATDWERFTEFASEVATQAEEEEEAEKALVEEREHREAMHQRLLQTRVGVLRDIVTRARKRHRRGGAEREKEEEAEEAEEDAEALRAAQELPSEVVAMLGGTFGEGALSEFGDGEALHAPAADDDELHELHAMAAATMAGGGEQGDGGGEEEVDLKSLLRRKKRRRKAVAEADWATGAAATDALVGTGWRDKRKA